MALLQDFDPRPAMGYEKAKSLFAQMDGTKMHNETRKAFDILVNERFASA